MEAIKTSLTHALPHLGQRILKTTLAVFLCLMVYVIFGLRGENLPSEAAITAIICMQPLVSDTKEYAFSRLSGTLIGAVLGMLFLVIFYSFPVLARSPLILYGLMGVGVMLSLYMAVLMHRPDASSLSAIVFLCIVIAYPEIDEPYISALTKVGDVLIGTSIAILVNLFRLPRTKDGHLIFFVKSRDLVPDRFATVSPTVLFLLNHLYGDGARICLISEHAPAYFTLQMSAAKIRTPLIVMDGAAIFDTQANAYLWSCPFEADTFDALEAALQKVQISYSVYAVRSHMTLVSHRGVMRPEEAAVQRLMQSSSYRMYLDEGEEIPGKVVCIKIILSRSETQDLVTRLEPQIRDLPVRYVIRPQNGVDRTDGLYIYCADATVENARAHLLSRLEKDDPALKAVDLTLSKPYETEKDAVRLLQKAGRLYEPVSMMPVKKRLKEWGESAATIGKKILAFIRA
ncbi:MAG: FUSC family protein [Clostridia bacterium]|nr:FUSC family protein [Clostridia bacterium]